MKELYRLKKGKGVYGNGQTQISKDDLLLIDKEETIAEYTLSDITANKVRLLKDNDLVSEIDLSPYLDNINKARIESGTVNEDGVVIFERGDGTKIIVDFSNIINKGLLVLNSEDQEEFISNKVKIDSGLTVNSDENSISLGGEVSEEINFEIVDRDNELISNTITWSNAVLSNSINNDDETTTETYQTDTGFSFKAFNSSNESTEFIQQSAFISNNTFLDGESTQIKQDSNILLNAESLDLDSNVSLTISSNSLIVDGREKNKNNQVLNVSNLGKITAPSLEIGMIIESKDLVTKEYVDTTISSLNTNVVNFGDFTIYKHPNNTNTELEVKDIATGWISDTTFIKGMYIGGDTSLITSWSIINEFEIENKLTIGNYEILQIPINVMMDPNNDMYPTGTNLERMVDYNVNTGVFIPEPYETVIFSFDAITTNEAETLLLAGTLCADTYLQLEINGEWVEGAYSYYGIVPSYYDAGGYGFEPEYSEYTDLGSITTYNKLNETVDFTTEKDDGYNQGEFTNTSKLCPIHLSDYLSDGDVLTGVKFNFDEVWEGTPVINGVFLTKKA